MVIIKYECIVVKYKLEPFEYFNKLFYINILQNFLCCSLSYPSSRLTIKNTFPTTNWIVLLALAALLVDCRFACVWMNSITASHAS